MSLKLIFYIAFLYWYTFKDFSADDYRLFCGDLGNEVNDEVLTKAFARFPSFNMARVSSCVDFLQQFIFIFFNFGGCSCSFDVDGHDWILFFFFEWWSWLNPLRCCFQDVHLWLAYASLPDRPFLNFF